MENFMHNKTTGNIISIQLLRAIAALSITYLHCTTAGNYKLFSTGAFGVDIFFIISGFIIAYMVSKNTENFLIKRIIRIVPLYFLATVAMTLTVMFFSGFLDNRTISISGFIKSILFIPGPENSGLPILIQGWSLNYEMFFYVIMFLCILFVKNKDRVVQKLQFLRELKFTTNYRLKPAKCRAFCKTCETTNRVVEQGQYLTIACISVLTSIIIALHLVNSTNFIINYYKNGLFLELIYGMILYHVYIRINKHSNGGGGGV
jgi:peptidoglycan/LPS O-acetylase OafA/YrhL